MALTEQERIQRATQAISVIENLYGVRVIATIERMADGTILFDTMKPRVVALIDWQPPEVEQPASPTADVKPGQPGVTASIDGTVLEPMLNGAKEPGRFEE